MESPSVDFTTCLTALYAELDDARAKVVSVPPGKVAGILRRYDQARGGAPLASINPLDPSSIRAALSPIHEALVDLNRALLEPVEAEEVTDKGLIELAYNPFDAFFAAAMKTRHPDQPGEDLQTQSLLLGMLGDPWEVVFGS